MGTVYEEVATVNGKTTKSTQEVKWTIDDNVYLVRNVPVSTYNGDEMDQTIGLGVSLKLQMIRDLMVAEEIPYDVDFSLVADIEFSDYV